MTRDELCGHVTDVLTAPLSASQIIQALLARTSGAPSSRDPPPRLLPFLERTRRRSEPTAPLKSTSAADRARMALKLERGEVQVLRFTRKQATGLAKVSAGYVGTLSRLTADERTQLNRGQLSLSRLHTDRRQHFATDAEETDHIIVWFGAEAILAGLDRATAPATTTVMAVE